MDLAATDGINAAVKKTKSFEYWDDKPAEEKIQSLSGYLEDVRMLRERVFCRC
jgi:D-amino-acid oxidase